MMPSPPRLVAIGLCAFFLSTTVASEPRVKASEGDSTELFEREIRPILVERCHSCHGLRVQKSGLRLDSRDLMLKGGASGPAIEPGDPDSSLLMEMIQQTGAIVMPPAPNKPLSKKTLAHFADWIRQGAPWPKETTTSTSSESWRSHWAFQPIRDTAANVSTRRPNWSKTSIDSFVLQGLEQIGLEPSPLADRRTLIKRATIGLTGLPPTAAEVDAFESDSTPDDQAYAKVLDRLLSSPRYGERWARHWLDVARYSDTKGYVFFEDANFPWAYTYRDYVIRSFNEDLPYNVFLSQQLAADQLPLGKDRRSLTAMGLITVGGRFINNRHDIIDDQIDVVTRGLLGLTVTCARCHDHKFDPIPTKDYYALYGVFASSIEPTVPPLFEEPPQTPQYREFERELAKRQQALVDYVTLKRDQLINSSRTRAAEYLVAANNARTKPTTEDFMLIADENDLNPAMIVRWQSYLERTRKQRDPVWSLWHALADLPESEFAVKAVDLIKQAPSRQAVNQWIWDDLNQKSPKTLMDVASVYAQRLNQAYQAGQEFQARANFNGDPKRPLPFPELEQLRQTFTGNDAPPNIVVPPTGDLSLLPDRASQAKLQVFLKSVEAWRATGPGAPPRAMVLEDLPKPYDPRVFRRGNPNQLGESTPRQFLEVLSHQRTPFQKGSGRLELAQAIVDPKNPLTARVIVNRVWMRHFGSPLVSTPSDFGLRSEPPSNPALLDHLAATFMAEGWSLKKLHRKILLSATYRQVSDDRPDGRAKDPENIKLWRMNRIRLDFEALRDSMLDVAGRLDSKIGGPSEADILSPNSKRRTMYGFIDRLNVPTLHRTFDFPDPNATSPKRDETTVPPQSLFLMNHPFVLESAKAVLKRTEIANATDRTEKLVRVYRLIYGRLPSLEEKALVDSFLNQGHNTETAWIRLIQTFLLSNEFTFLD